MQKIIEEKIGKPQICRWDSVHTCMHFHDEVEVIYVISGEINAVTEGKARTLTPGTFYLVMPNQLHNYDWLDSGVDYICCVINPELLGIKNSNFLKYEPAEPLIPAKDKTAIRLLELALEEYDGENDYNTLISLLTAFFGKLLPLYTMVESVKHSERVAEILSYCERNYKEDVSCETASKALGISRSYISHITRTKLQSTFMEYINQLRISDALALISEGKSITEAALESGFTTIRTFNRAFKRIHGVSPRQYISALPPSAKDSNT